MKTLITLFTILLASVSAFAQSNDIVHLKNGSVIKCIILEQIPGESVRIKTSDGSIYVYLQSEIHKIEKAQPQVVSVPIENDVQQLQQAKIDQRPPARKWRFGGGFGYNIDFYTLKLSEATQGSYNASDYISSVWSPEVHASIQYRPSRFAIESGLSFLMKGFKMNAGRDETTFRQWYLGVPFLAKYHFTDSENAFYAFAGVRFDFLLFSSLEANNESFGNANKLYRGVIPSAGLGVGFRYFRLGVYFPLSSSVLSNEFDRALSDLGYEQGYSGVKFTVNYVTMKFTASF